MVAAADSTVWEGGATAVAAGGVPTEMAGVELLLLPTSADCTLRLAV